MVLAPVYVTVHSNVAEELPVVGVAVAMLIVGAALLIVAVLAAVDAV